MNLSQKLSGFVKTFRSALLTRWRDFSDSAGGWPTFTSPYRLWDLTSNTFQGNFASYMVRLHWYWSWRPAETLWSREFVIFIIIIWIFCNIVACLVKRILNFIIWIFCNLVPFLGGESPGKSEHKREDERCFEEQGGGKSGGLSHCYQICATRVLVFKCKSRSREE